MTQPKDVHVNPGRITSVFACLMATGVLAAGAGPAVPPWGVDLSYMDSAVKPGNDYFSFANGGWVKTAVIPPDRSYAGVNLELNKQNEARLQGIINSLVATPEAQLDANGVKLRNLYEAFTDLSQIEANGLKPASADLARIAALQTHDDVARMMADPALSLDGPFNGGITPDDKNPSAYVFRIGQSGLGLPDRDYYLLDDKALADTRVAYLKYLTTMLAYSGAQDADARAKAVPPQTAATQTGPTIRSSYPSWRPSRRSSPGSPISGRPACTRPALRGSAR